MQASNPGNASYPCNKHKTHVGPSIKNVCLLSPDLPTILPPYTKFFIAISDVIFFLCFNSVKNYFSFIQILQSTKVAIKILFNFFFFL